MCEEWRNRETLKRPISKKNCDIFTDEKYKVLGLPILNKNCCFTCYVTFEEEVRHLINMVNLRNRMAKKHLKTTKINTLRMITEQTFIDNFFKHLKAFSKEFIIFKLYYC